MSERSVSNIRAMFEAKETSPPSRGRSPAGSERSGANSRNVSSIRSSFVAVERSGQTGPLLGLRRVSDVAGASPAALDRLRPSDMSPSQVGGNPLSRSSSLSKVQEEDGGLGKILKGSPFEDGKKAIQAQAGTPDAQSTLMAKLAANASNTTGKYQASLPKAQQAAPAETKPEGAAAATASPSASTPAAKPAPISTKTLAVKNGPTSAKTPTSATRSGPAVKVSSPRTSTATVAAKAPTKKAEPKLTTRSSRQSLSATAPTTSSAGHQATRGKSPIRPTTTQAKKPPRTSNVTPAPKPPRQSVGGADSDFLARMSRPMQRQGREEKPEEKKAAKPTTKAPDNGFLERMMKPTAASASKHQEDQPEQSGSTETSKTVKSATKTSDSSFLERMMKPTASSARKHDTDEREDKAEVAAGVETHKHDSHKPDPKFFERMMKPTASSARKHESEVKEDRKSPRPSVGGRTPDSGFLDRMTKPTASSSSRTANEPHVEPHRHAGSPTPKPGSSSTPTKSKPKEIAKSTVESMKKSQTKEVEAAAATTATEAAKGESNAREELAQPISLANESAAPRPDLVVRGKDETKPAAAVVSRPEELPAAAPVPIVPIKDLSAPKGVEKQAETPSESTKEEKTSEEAPIPANANISESKEGSSIDKAVKPVDASVEPTTSKVVKDDKISTAPRHEPAIPAPAPATPTADATTDAANSADPTQVADAKVGASTATKAGTSAKTLEAVADPTEKIEVPATESPEKITPPTEPAKEAKESAPPSVTPVSAAKVKPEDNLDLDAEVERKYAPVEKPSVKAEVQLPSEPKPTAAPPASTADKTKVKLGDLLDLETEDVEAKGAEVNLDAFGKE